MSIVRFWPAVCLAAALAAPRAGPAQARRALPPRLQPATRATIERLADSLAHESIPSGPLYDKAAEGVLKGADDGRIVIAVQGLAQRLRAARGLLGSAAPDAEVEAAASAIHAGAPQSVIRRLVDERNTRLTGRGLGVPLVVLANLIADGVPATTAMASLTALLERGARDEALSGFRLGVVHDIEGGASPVTAATLATSRLVRALSDQGRRP